MAPCNPTRYDYYGASKSMQEAQDECVRLGGNLASAHSQNDADAIEALVPAGGRAWIGYHDRDQEAGCTDARHEGIGGAIQATTFIWTDATVSNYENWAAGEPNDWQAGVAHCDGTGNEDCTEAWRGGENWNDANCDGAKPFVCGFNDPGDCDLPVPEVSGITTNSVDSDGDCRSFLTGSGCYTPGVLVQVDSAGQATGSFHESISGDDLKYYGDRNYVMTEVPPFLVGMNYVRTANDDKRADENDLNFLCFDVGSDATVYVLYDSRASTLPGWVAADFVDKHQAAAIHTDTNMAQGFEIYWNEVAQGNICMGGNGQTGAGSNYIVVVGPPGVQAAGR
jgi:hypothetical protein